MTSQEIIQKENAFQIATYAKAPLALVRGKGSYVWDAEDKRYLDFYGGHCVTSIGHCPDPVVEAIKRQAETLIFYSNVVYSPVRATAAELLSSVAPEHLKRVFFCNSGTEANETALKLARKHTGRSAVIAMEGSFHGRTLGSLATTWPEHYREPYSRVLPKSEFIPFGDIDAAADALARATDIAAILVEPIQWSGMWAPGAEYFKKLRALCDRHGCMLIFDEVQTGVGRTGTFSISESLGVQPDLITMAKSLGSGVPAGAVLVSDAIATGVRAGDQGSTFGGGMLAMAAVTATIRTIMDQKLMTRTRRVFDLLSVSVSDFAVDTRGQGCLIGIELDQPAKPVVGRLREAGVLAGGTVHPNVVRIMPPLNTTDEQIEFFTSALRKAATENA